MKARHVLAFALLLAATLANAQGHYIGVAQNTLGQGVANVTVRVCTEPAIGTPCSPLPSAIYTCAAMDSTCPGGNPFTGDQYGNFDFYAPPGVAYHIQLSGQSLQQTDLSYVYVPSLAAGGIPGGVPFSLQYNNTGVFNGILGTNGQIPIGQTGAAPIFQTITGDSTLNTAGLMVNTGLNGTNLAGLATGVLYNTTATGVPSIATAAQIANPFGCPGTKAYLYSGSSGTGCDNAAGTGNVSNSVNFPLSSPYYVVMSDGGSVHTVSPYPNGGLSSGGALTLNPIGIGSDLNLFHFVSSWLSVNNSGSGISSSATNDTNPGHGSVIHQLAKFTIDGYDRATTSDTDTPVWIVVSGGSAGSTVDLAVLPLEVASCIFDSGGASIGHYVVASTVAGGECADSGIDSRTTPPPAGVWIVGIANGSGSGLIQVWTLNQFGGGGSSGSFASLSSGTNVGGTFTLGNGTTMTVTGTGVNNANQVNAGMIPASAGVIGTNGSSQFVSNPGTISNNTSGNANTATSFAATPGQCTGYAHGVDAFGNCQGDPPSSDSDVIFNIQARPGTVSGKPTPAACGVDSNGFYCINASLANLVNVQSFYKASSTYTLVGAGDSGTAVVTITVDTPVAAQWYDVGAELVESNTPAGCSGGATAAVRLDYTNADNSVAVTGQNNIGLSPQNSGAGTSIAASATVSTSAPSASQIWDGTPRRVHVAASTALKMILWVLTDTLSGCSPFPQLTFSPIVYKVQ